MIEATDENGNRICFLCGCLLSDEMSNIQSKDEVDNPAVLLCIVCARKIKAKMAISEGYGWKNRNGWKNRK